LDFVFFASAAHPVALCFRLVRPSVSVSGTSIPEWPLAVDFQFSHILTLLLPVSVGWASGRASGLKKMSDEVLVW